jgi:hypothetical protein
MKFSKDTMPTDGQPIYYPDTTHFTAAHWGELYDPSLDFMRVDAEGGWCYSTPEEADAIAAQMLNVQKIVEAAQAVVERWDSPKWARDSVHTSKLINDLRKAIQ